MAGPYIDTHAAAKHLGLSPLYLRKLRTKGGGPRFYKFGRRVKYTRADLDAWAEENAAHNTSEYTATA